MTPRGWPLSRHFLAPPSWELLRAFSLKSKARHIFFLWNSPQSGRNVVITQQPMFNAVHCRNQRGNYCRFSTSRIGIGRSKISLVGPGEAERVRIIGPTNARYESFGQAQPVTNLLAQDSFGDCVLPPRGRMQESVLRLAMRLRRRAVHGLRERRARFGELVWRELNTRRGANGDKTGAAADERSEKWRRPGSSEPGQVVPLGG